MHFTFYCFMPSFVFLIAKSVMGRSSYGRALALHYSLFSVWFYTDFWRNHEWTGTGNGNRYWLLLCCRVACSGCTSDTASSPLNLSFAASAISLLMLERRVNSQVNADSHGDSTLSHPTSNHALMIQTHVINQTWNPVSLGLRDTEVRAYRTDPVQVRSCSFNSRSQIKYHFTLVFPL
ncbi:hypothetical protein V6N12_011621 [Hibiscus sabdariffa]|uniref:Secreted protein n=1 Tax=Hibiscus sabdariffa TaxID=183260 RepID=A0ABR2AZ17_9ROSI